MTDQRVQIEAFDPAWGQRFAEQKASVETPLAGVLAEPVQHIGSTSVPGLPAKPVIDILALVRSLADATERVPQLSQAGWLFWPDDPNRDYRLWFCDPHPRLAPITCTSSSSAIHRPSRCWGSATHFGAARSCGCATQP
jgi:GrpB-like predicted nucleotidyltransferase (UPF0157 family)